MPGQEDKKKKESPESIRLCKKEGRRLDPRVFSLPLLSFPLSPSVIPAKAGIQSDPSHCEERVFFLFRPFDRVSVANEWRNLSEKLREISPLRTIRMVLHSRRQGGGGVIARLYSAVVIQSFGWTTCPVA